MEFLKKILLSAGILLISIQLIQAQEYLKQQDAFRKSYEAEAKKEYTNAINSLKVVYDDKSYELNLRLGWLNYLTGNYNDSRSFYTKATALMPYSIEAKIGLAYPLAAQGNINEVVVLYEKILEIAPNYSIALFKLGMIHYEKGDFEKALKYFEKVANLWPFDYDALVMLGWTYYRLNNVREARVLFQKALLHTPDGKSAIEGLNLLK